MYKEDVSRKSPEPNKTVSRKSFLQEVTTMVCFPETFTTESIFSLNQNSCLTDNNVFYTYFFPCYVSSNAVLWSWAIQARAGL